MGLSSVTGLDDVLNVAPPLTSPPLSLLDIARSLVDVPDLIGKERQAIEDLATLQKASEVADLAFSDLAADALDDARAAALEAVATSQSAVIQAEQLVNDRAKARAAVERWEQGFEFIPELGRGALEIFVPGSGANKAQGNNQPASAWYKPFEVVARDERSLFGRLSLEERVQRTARAELAHEAWQVEREFWTGAKIPTNYHLTAGPATALTSPQGTITAWGNPTAAAGTTLGTIYGLRRSLAALDQSIADADAGVGVIHATPYLVQIWSSVYPYLRDSAGRLMTVNLNYIVPGYGYPGTGPDTAARTVADGVTNSTTTVTSATAAFSVTDIGAAISGTGIPVGATIVAVASATSVTISAAATASASGVSLTIGPITASLAGGRYEWAYATDMVYKLRGPVQTYPRDYGQQGSLAYNQNSAAIRAERSWAIISNQLLRAAVLVDTETV